MSGGEGITVDVILPMEKAGSERVRRAAVAVWVSALGVWVWGPADTLTSLAAAGILMTAVNSYAVWDIGLSLIHI